MPPKKMRGRHQPAGYYEQRSMTRSYGGDEMQNYNNAMPIMNQRRENLQAHQIISECAKLYDSQNYYEQEPYEAPGPSWSHRNDSYQDDAPHETQNYIPLSRGKKRPYPNRRGNPSTHYSGHDRSVEDKFGPRLGPKPARQPYMPGPNVPWGGNHEPAPKRAFHAPNIPNKHIVGKALRPQPNIEDHTLRPNREPSTSLNGLLELGLGAIMKQIKHTFGHWHKYKGTLSREYYVRRLKKILRTRIRNILMNKYINDYVVVVEEYRNKFPLKTDEELLIIVKECKPDPSDVSNAVATSTLKSAKACQTFFKKNLKTVARDKLREMFQKVVTMYDQEYNNAKAAANKSADTKEANTKYTQDQPTPLKWNIDIAEVIKERFFSRFRIHLPIIHNILYMSPDFRKEKANLLSQTMKRDPTITDDMKANIKYDQNFEIVDVDADQDPEVVEIDPEEVEVDPEVVEVDPEVVEVRPEVIEVDPEVVEVDPEVVEVDAEVVKVNPEPLHYVATVRGIPKLPNRKIMRPYLFKFRPKLIQTHKKIQNLLIIKFDDKEIYDSFLQQNGHKFDDSVLEIKTSGKLVLNPVQAQNNSHVINGEDKTENNDLNKSNDTIISSDTENQINDLLTSLSQDTEEEPPKEEKNAEGNLETNVDKEKYNEGNVNEAETENDNNVPSKLCGELKEQSNTTGPEDNAIQGDTISESKEIDDNDKKKSSETQTSDEKQDEVVEEKSETVQ